MDWDKLFKRYIWDDVRTPYFTSVDKLNRRQADYEVYVYVMFVAVFFATLTFTATTDHLPAGPSTLIATYAFTVVCAAIVFGFTKHYWSAVYCAVAPVTAGFYLAINGFPPNLSGLDHVFIVAAILGVLVYSWRRIVVIGRTYQSMARPSDPEESSRRRTLW